ncbi:response regulator transcription factor [Chitinophaga agrisoli]|uniref:Response regulator transcription factor n=1 Tax=Chitinophaga agrisoli TaxID=2607653 RepID=A0A5B2VWT4_9BACT|nr:LytTR family DNA-binding domain-containing protein [Chitinophaga agrisoli]KAA2243781.1 response regulator transcription factor [Chitinophaga agrisoli]
MKVRCMIIDDEPPAQELLRSYVSKIEHFEITAVCSNALEAFAMLQKNTVDIIFLDIAMPQMSGLELIRSLPQKPPFIFTTAFREYGADGYELDALDYLVKPITFDRFLKAVAKFHQYKTYLNQHEAGHLSNAFEQAYLYFKVNKELAKVYLKEIIYIESIKDYIRIVTDSRSMVTYQRISYMEEKLPESRFMRVHKSYIIALDRVSGFCNDLVAIDKYSIPVGRSYKQKFMEYLR